MFYVYIYETTEDLRRFEDQMQNISTRVVVLKMVENEAEDDAIMQKTKCNNAENDTTMHLKRDCKENAEDSHQEVHPGHFLGESRRLRF